MHSGSVSMVEVDEVHAHKPPTTCIETVGYLECVAYNLSPNLKFYFLNFLAIIMFQDVLDIFLKEIIDLEIS